MLPRPAIGLAVALATILAGCSILGGGLALGGRTFLSTAVSESGVARPLVAGTRIRLAFQAERISASAGCNTMGGTYRIDGDRLVVGQLAMTEIGCDADRAAQDDWLAGFLGSGPAAELSGDTLLLTAGPTVIRLVDREVAEPDRPLVGTTWDVSGILGGDTASSVPAGASAWVRFGGGGHYDLNSGCNAGGGAYRIEGSTIHLSEQISTAMACLGAKGDLEADVLAVLGQSAVTYHIEGNVLTLTAGQRGLQLTAR